MDLKHILLDEEATPNDRPRKRQSWSPPSASSRAHFSEDASSQNIPPFHLNSGAGKFSNNYTYFNHDQSDSESASPRASMSPHAVADGEGEDEGEGGRTPTPTPSSMSTPEMLQVEETTPLPRHDNGTPTKSSIATAEFLQFNSIAQQENHVPSAMEVDETNGQALLSLPNKHHHIPLKQREELYHELYSNLFIPLENLGQLPARCSEVPELSEEILAAYHEHATFVVSIWTNYDSAIRRFYKIAKRRESCGKVVLSPRARARLEKLDPRFAMHKVRLDIGTPFRTLVEIDIFAMPDVHGGDYTFRFGGRILNDVNGPHGLVAQLGADFIQAFTGERSSQAITLSDLDYYASWFLHLPHGGYDASRDFRG